MTTKVLMSALLAAVFAAPIPAFAQTAPVSTSPDPTSSNNPITGSISVSANTNQADGSVNYQIDNTKLTSQGGTTPTLRHRSGSGGRSCVGMTPDQAGVQFVGTGMTITPLYQGQHLPFVGDVPASASGDPANSTTLSNAV